MKIFFYLNILKITDQTLEYDYMHTVITGEIDKANGHGIALVSWISSEDSLNAAFSHMSLEEPPIESIQFQTYF